MANVEVNVLKAGHGDCLFISIKGENTYNILIDGGTSFCYERKERNRMVPGALKLLIEELKENNEHIDLLILTHIDDDHIGGLKEWFENDFPTTDFVRELWFNDGNAIEIYDKANLNNSVRKAITLIDMMDEKGFAYKTGLLKGVRKDIPSGFIKILAPDRTDYAPIEQVISDALLNSSNTNYKKSIKDLLNEKFDSKEISTANKASLAFWMQVEGENYLLLGDADVDTICAGLRSEGFSFEHPMICKMVKLSHHGSKNNFSMEFLKLIRTRKFVVSTDGKYFGHPDKEVIARIVASTEADIFFNYKERAEEIFTPQDYTDYPKLKERIKEC